MKIPLNFPRQDLVRGLNGAAKKGSFSEAGLSRAYRLRSQATQV